MNPIQVQANQVQANQVQVNGVNIPQVNGVNIPVFLTNTGYRGPSWKHERWKQFALGCLPLFGTVPAIYYAATKDTPSVAFAKQIQRHISNLPANTDFQSRREVTLQAFKTLKILKAATQNSPKENLVIDLIAKNISNSKFKKLLDGIEGITVKYSTDAGHGRVLDQAKIDAVGFDDTKNALSKIKELIASLEELDQDPSAAYFDKNDYLDNKGPVSGLTAYKDTMEARLATIKTEIATQKTALKRLVKEVRTSVRLTPEKRAIWTNSLAQIRTALITTQHSSGPETCKEMGIRGIDNLSSFLDSVQEYIDTGYAAKNVGDFDVNELQQQRFAPGYDFLLGGGVSSILAGVGMAFAAGAAMPVFVTAGVAAGVVGTFVTNYWRGGFLYQLSKS